MSRIPARHGISQIALMGLGAAIVYLAVWAAALLYAFLPPPTAIAALAGVSLGLAGVAWVIGLEALATTAALGAFFAPIVVGAESGNTNMLLLYLAAMGAALGWVAQAPALAAHDGGHRPLLLRGRCPGGVSSG